jgi:hypothetical protein
MPSHQHLLSTEEEITDYYLSKSYSEDECKNVLYDIYQSPIINRVMFDDYIKLFAKHFYMVASEIMYNDVDSELLKLLRKTYPENSDFSAYGGKFLLKNRK